MAEFMKCKKILVLLIFFALNFSFFLHDYSTFSINREEIDDKQIKLKPYSANSGKYE